MGHLLSRNRRMEEMTQYSYKKCEILDHIPYDLRTELFVSGYVANSFKQTQISTDIIDTIIKFYQIPNGPIFDQNNKDERIKLSGDNDDIVQNLSSFPTLSILGAQVVHNNESFHWEFKITEWSHRCVRFGIMSPEVKAQGSIWMQPDSICMCIFKGCWNCLWGACTNPVYPKSHFKNGETIGIKICNYNHKCYASWCHNGEPIQNATNIPTKLEKATFFFEFATSGKVVLERCDITNAPHHQDS